jgi:hypothetical protein
VSLQVPEELVLEDYEVVIRRKGLRTQGDFRSSRIVGISFPKGTDMARQRVTIRLEQPAPGVKKSNLTYRGNNGIAEEDGSVVLDRTDGPLEWSREFDQSEDPARRVQFEVVDELADGTRSTQPAEFLDVEIPTLGGGGGGEPGDPDFANSKLTLVSIVEVPADPSAPTALRR